MRKMIDGIAEAALYRPWIAGLVAAGTIALVLLLSHGHGGAPHRQPQAAATAPTPSATLAPSPTSTLDPTGSPSATQTPDDADEAPQPAQMQRAQDAARRFTQAWLDDGGTQNEWLAGMRGYAMDDLLDGLAYTDRANIPAGHVAKLTLTERGGTDAQVQITLDTGTRLDVAVATDPAGVWRVTNISAAGT